MNNAVRLVLLLAVAALAMAGAVWMMGGMISGGDRNSPERIALGKRLYAENCASCHGAGLEGEPDWRTRKPDGTLPAPPHDETGHTWHHDPETLFKITKYGGQSVAPADFKSAMPGFGDTLSDDEIRAVLAFIESTWPEDIRRAYRERFGG